MNIKYIASTFFNYLWLLLVLIPYFGGLGFIFAGWNVNETKWIDEGIIYMIPFILLSFTILNMSLVYLAIIFWIIGIIRAAFIFKAYQEKLKQKQIEKGKNKIFENNYQIKQAYEKDTNSPEKLENKAIPVKNFNNSNNQLFEINNASYEELIKIPHINSEMADKIIQLRKTGQYINSMNDLSVKLKLKDDEIKEIKNYISFRTKKYKNIRKLDL